MFASPMRKFVGSVCLGLGLLRLANGQGCEVSDNAGYEFMVEPTTGFTVHWNTPTATDVSFMVEYAGDAYVSLGFSADGGMIGSDAVIGLPDPDTMQAFEYDLGDYFLGAGGVEQSATQEITGQSVTQARGVTSLAFTRPLAPTGAGKEVLLAAGPNNLLWAFGNTNTLDYHFENRGIFALDLAGCAAAATTDPPVATPSAAPTAAPVAASSPSVVPTAAPSGDEMMAMTPEPMTDGSSTEGPIMMDDEEMMESGAPSPSPAVDGSFAPTSAPAGEGSDDRDVVGTSGAARAAGGGMSGAVTVAAVAAASAALLAGTGRARRY